LRARTVFTDFFDFFLDAMLVFLRMFSESFMM
jgi:hypothetical protein